MDRRQLESAGANYPQGHLQALYAVPFGLMQFLIALSNLQRQPLSPWALGALLLLCFAVFGGVSRYYQLNFGRVTPVRSRQVRYFVAVGVGFAAFTAAGQLGRTVLGRPPRHPVTLDLVGWALGMLVFYAITPAGLRAHHVAIWGSLLVAGLLPIWGLGVDRDALAYLPIGAGTISSGVVDHLLWVRTLRSSKDLHLANSDAGA